MSAAPLREEPDAVRRQADDLQQLLERPRPQGLTRAAATGGAFRLQHGNASSEDDSE